jgi:hypothetical protein
MPTSNLGLNLPSPPEEPPKETFDFSVDAIKKWYDELQTVDLEKNATDFITRLRVMHHAQLDVNNRMQVLEILRPLTQVIHRGLKKHYTNQTSPLSEQKLAKLKLSNNLQIEMLYGYKTIIENISSTNQGKSSLPDAIYLAFKHYNNLLSNYYNTYTQIPENTWQEIHNIFKYAIDSGIHLNKITLDTKDNNITVITPYKQALFVASTRPYQWRQIEQDMLYSYGVAWNEYIDLRKFESSDQNAANDVFFVPINQDAGPFVATIENSPIVMESSGYTLDLSKLTTYLKKIQEDPKELAQQTVMATYSLQKLINYLINGTKRKLERFNIMGQVVASFGLPATHYHINKKKKFHPESVGHANADDDDSEELQLGADLGGDSMADGDSSFQANTALYKCKLTNIHGEGAGIIVEDMKYPPIQPGEIVAMAFAEDDKLEADETHWNIGTIRWLQHNREQRLLAGIEILAPFAMAAAVQLIKDDKPVGYYQRAFLCQVSTEGNTGFNIITPIVQFEPDKTVKIYSYYHKKEIETKLKELLANNNNFKCFAVDLDLPTDLKKSDEIKSDDSDMSGELSL